MIKKALPEETEKHFSHVFDKNLVAGKLYSTTIELTRRCNFSCIHCYNLSHNSQPDLPTKKLLELIDSLTEMECLYLVFTGGEPLIHKDFRTIWSHAYKKGLLLTLFTNGYLLDKDLVAFLKKYPPYDIEITMYGFSSRTYGETTGNSKAFETVTGNIRNLKKENFRFSLKTVVLKHNIKEVPEIYRFARSMNVTFRYDLNISPTLEGGGTSSLFVPSADILQLFNIIKDSEKATCELLDNVKKSREYFKDGDNLYTCGAGKASVYVDHCGNVYPCALARGNTSNICDKPISRIIKEDIPVWFEKKITSPDINACRNCRDSYYCDWCPAIEDNPEISDLEKKRWKTNICRIAKLQKENFEKKLPASGKLEESLARAGYFELKYK